MQTIPTSTDKLLVHADGGVAWITFNNPARHNAVSLAMWQAIPVILRDLAQSADIRCLVLKGAGDKAFVSGADISEFESKRSSEEGVREYNAASEHAGRALREFSKPIVAMIRGICYGGGMALALCADLRICSEDARFAIPAARLGLGYRYDAVERLAQIVGPQYAAEILLTAQSFNAAEARDMGLVNRVVPVAELETRATTLARSIAANAPLTVVAAKAALQEYCRNPADRDVERIAELVSGCYASADYIEGRRAFMEKRKPAFRGV